MTDQWRPEQDGKNVGEQKEQKQQAASQESEVTSAAGAVEGSGVVEDSGAVASSGTVEGSGAVDSSGTVKGSGVVEDSGAVASSGTVESSGADGSSGAVEGSGVVEDSGAVASSGTVESSGADGSSGAVEGSGADGSSGAVEGSGAVDNSGTVEGSGAVEGSGVIESSGRSGRRLWLSLLWTVIGLVILAGGGFLTAKAILDKSPKEQYLLAEWRSLSSASKDLRGIEQDKALRKALEDRGYSYALEMSADFSGQSDDREETEQLEEISKVLQEFTVRLSGQNNTSEKWTDTRAQLLRKGKTIFDLMVMVDEEQIVFGSDEMFDKQYFVNFDELEEQVPELGEVIRSLETGDGELYQLTEEQIELIGKRYGTFLLEHLKDEYFTQENGVTVSTPKGTVRGKRITLELNDAALKELLAAFVDLLRADQELQQLFVDRLYTIMLHPELSDVMDDIEGDKEYLAEIVEDLLYEIKQEILEMRSIGRLHIEAVIARGRIVERNITFRTNMFDGRMDIKMNTLYWDEKGGGRFSETKATLTMDEGYQGRTVIELEVNTEISETRESVTRSSDVYLSARNDHDTAFEGELELRSTYAKTDNGTDRHSFNVHLESGGDEVEAGGELRIRRNQNMREDRASRNFELNLEYEATNYFGERAKFSLGLDIDADVTFDDDMKKPALDKSAVNLIGISDEELEELGNQMLEKMSELMAN